MYQKTTDFKSHTDNVNETISAEHVNVIHEAVNEVEKNVAKTVKESQYNQAFRVFQESNATCMNLLSEQADYRMSEAHSYGVKISQAGELVLQQGVEKGVFVSESIASHLYEDPQLESISMMAQVIHSDGIEFEILTETGETYSFDEIGVCSLKESVPSFRMKATLTRTPNGESPIVQLLCLFYNDRVVAKGLSYLLQGE